METEKKGRRKGEEEWNLGAIWRRGMGRGCKQLEMERSGREWNLG